MLLLRRLARSRDLVRRLEVPRRIDVRRREDRLLPQDTDTRVGELGLVLADARGALLLALLLRVPAALDGVGIEHVGSGREESRPLLDRERPEHPAVARDRFEELGGRA